MSKSEIIPQHRYKVEEKHRGDWVPLEAKDAKGKKIGQKVVKITEEEAEIMNIDADKTRIRYVREDKKDVKKDDGGGEKPLDKMSKPELEAKAKELGVEFTDEHTNNEKRAAFLQSVIDAKE